MLEILKQTIEALEKISMGGDPRWADDVIPALRQAIADLESQAQPKQVNELHTCPYREELHGDYETLCACDREATHQCAMDI